MCGLVGVICNHAIPKPLVEVFSQMVEVNSLRGRHSTGVIRLGSEGSRWYKKAVNGPVFVNQKDGFEFINGGKNVRALLAHNRWATRGEVNHANAHPFRKGPITLMHNGTLRSQANLPDYRDYEVDSENIAHSMHVLGEKETLEKLNGAYALVWYNSKDNSINFARNSERPLYFAITTLGSVIYASERKMLEWICDRNRINVKTIVSLPTLRHLKIDLKDIDGWANAKETPFLEYNPWAWGKQPANNVAHGNKNVYDVRSELMEKHPVSTIVEAYIYDFREYPNQKGVGVGIGALVDKPYTPVELLGFRKDAPKGLYDCKIASYSTTYDGRKSAVNILSRKYDLVESDDDIEDKVQTPILPAPEKEDKKNKFTLYQGPRKEFITAKEFELLTKHGCTNCGGNLDVEDADHIVWGETGCVYCPSCVKEFLGSPDDKGKAH